MKGTILFLLLAACAAPATSSVSRPVISDTCPAGAPQPLIPHLPYTIKTLETYANDLRRALTITEDARTECSRQFNSLVALVNSTRTEQ